MEPLKFYNTLGRKIEEFVPADKKTAKIYSCGPTVYDFPHIGNWRTFVFDDLVRRVIEYNGYGVDLVMNATDVGHLTGDNIGSADSGEDRMEKAAKREQKSVWDIAAFYITDFTETRNWLNILPPTYFVRATDHIEDQINLIKQLEEKGLTYTTNKGVYFDTARFPDYGKLGGQKLTDKRALSREELVEDPQKKSPTDFALWKYSVPADRRQMEWESPWGKGFPGWHIECSAMSMKYLGETLDIHTGGVDHIAIHHTNEIAQSEGATGRPFARFWMHGEFLTVDGGRMGKSLGNAYNLHQIVEHRIHPLALRFFYLSAHYRQVLNFTWEAVQGSQIALERLWNKVEKYRQSSEEYEGQDILINNKKPSLEDHIERFKKAVNEDLNIPQAIGAMQVMLDDKKIKNSDKLKTLLDFDRVLGIGLDKHDLYISVSSEIKVEEAPLEVQAKINSRQELKAAKDFTGADRIREEIEKMGYTVKDTPEGAKLAKK